MMWQHEAHGKALPALYRQRYKVDANTEEEKEGTQVDEGEGKGKGKSKGDGEKGDGSKKGKGKGKGEENNEDHKELADRRANAETVSESMLEAVCVQTQSVQGVASARGDH
ncbi:hypothetical protein B0H14DRAFT_3515593 [Mycena olivaceomarginata]|nr:hypothetical protein B0H14DRAFT_3515593 [Mycena olivaceomarginata]